MADLPTVGGSSNTWGDELNTWLVVDHNADGTNYEPLFSDNEILSYENELLVEKD